MSRRAGLVVVAVLLSSAVAAPGASCTSAGGTSATSPSASAPSPRPSSTAKLAILEPRDGAVLHTTTIPLRVSLKDAHIVPATSTNLRPDEGHLHVIVDDRLVTMTSSLHENIPGVKPGTHLLRVEFVANDHAPFDPRVIAQVSFRVKT
jgi:Family of unknown function (DUF6130)